MMSMRMQITIKTSKAEAHVRRRARVIAWRLANGELIRFNGDDPAWEYVSFGYRVPSGLASGAVPTVL